MVVYILYSTVEFSILKLIRYWPIYIVTDMTHQKFITIALENVIYTPILKARLELIRITANELAKTDSEKTVEQFIEEIKFIEDLLDQAKRIDFLSE